MSWTLMKTLNAFAGPGKIKRREVVLDLQVSPEEIKSREAEFKSCVKSRLPSWAVRPNEPSGFRGRKAILNHAHALVSAYP